MWVFLRLSCSKECGQPTDWHMICDRLTYETERREDLVQATSRRSNLKSLSTSQKEGALIASAMDKKNTERHYVRVPAWLRRSIQACNTLCYICVVLMTGLGITYTISLEKALVADMSSR